MFRNLGNDLANIHDNHVSLSESQSHLDTRSPLDPVIALDPHARPRLLHRSMSLDNSAGGGGGCVDTSSVTTIPDYELAEMTLSPDEEAAFTSSDCELADSQCASLASRLSDDDEEEEDLDECISDLYCAAAAAAAAQPPSDMAADPFARIHSIPPQHLERDIMSEMHAGHMHSHMYRPAPPDPRSRFDIRPPAAAAVPSRDRKLGSSGGKPAGQEPTLMDRIIALYTVWYLPNVTREQAINYLIHRKPGNFIVRHSSQSSPKSGGVMALSMRSSSNQPDKMIEHFLIVAKQQGLQIDEADSSFVTILELLEHYHNFSDGLPCKLSLPDDIMAADNGELGKYWMLGQKYWDKGLEDADHLTGSNSDISVDAANGDTLGRCTSSNKSLSRDDKPPPVPPKDNLVKQMICHDLSVNTNLANRHIHRNDPPIHSRANLARMELHSSGGGDIVSPIGSAGGGSKTTPSDSGYDTSTKNMFDFKVNQAMNRRSGSKSTYLFEDHPFSQSYPVDMRGYNSAGSSIHTPGGSSVGIDPNFNPFTFPSSETTDPRLRGPSCSSTYGESSYGGVNPNLDLSVTSSTCPLIPPPPVTQPVTSQMIHQDFSHRISCTFSDDTSISMQDSRGDCPKFNPTNPFLPLVSRSVSTAAQQHSNPTYEKSNSAETMPTHATLSSCESIRSTACLSDNSSSSSLLSRPELLSGLYGKGRSKFCNAPSTGISPNSFANHWMSPVDDPELFNCTPSIQRLASSPTGCACTRMSQEDQMETQNDAGAVGEDVAQSSLMLLDKNDQAKHPKHSSKPTNRKRIPSFLAPPRFLTMLRRRKGNPSNKIRDFILQLAEDEKSTFHAHVTSFIKEAQCWSETDPALIMTRVREKMNALKIYLLGREEKELADLVDRERLKLRATEYINLDSIIEIALHKIILRPLKRFILDALIQHHTSVGNLAKLETNLNIAKEKDFSEELGIPPHLIPPNAKHLHVVGMYLLRMQDSYSPLTKLESFLAATKVIYNSVEISGTLKPTSMGAEEYLPMLIYSLAHFGFKTVEVEAEYIWRLLPPHMLTGEAGYYMTALSSAAHILKNMPGEGIDLNSKEATSCDGSKSPSSTHLGSNLPCIADIQGFMKVVVPDEKLESIISKTLPVPPNMSTNDVCAMLAHKLKLSHNPDEYGLYVVVDGQEERLEADICPQQIKANLVASNKGFIFAYKRLTAHIIWPSCGGGNSTAGVSGSASSTAAAALCSASPPSSPDTANPGGGGSYTTSAGNCSGPTPPSTNSTLTPTNSGSRPTSKSPGPPPQPPSHIHPPSKSTPTSPVCGGSAFFPPVQPTSPTTTHTASLTSSATNRTISLAAAQKAISSPSPAAAEAAAAGRGHSGALSS